MYALWNKTANRWLHVGDDEPAALMAFYRRSDAELARERQARLHGLEVEVRSLVKTHADLEKVIDAASDRIQDNATCDKCGFCWVDFMESPSCEIRDVVEDALLSAAEPLQVCRMVVEGHPLAVEAARDALRVAGEEVSK